MPAQDLQALLAAAQDRVRGARTRLERPRACNLDECVTLLREAQGYLEWLRDSLPGAPVPRDLRARAAALARDIRHAGILLEQAARYGRRWLERLQLSGGYTPSGLLAPLEARGRLSFLG